MQHNNEDANYWWQRKFEGDAFDRADISDVQLLKIAETGADPRHFWRLQGRCLCCGQELVFVEFQEHVQFVGRCDGNVGAVFGITVICEGSQGLCCDSRSGHLCVWRGGSSLLEQWNGDFSHAHLSFRPAHADAAAREQARLAHSAQCEYLGLGPVNLRCYERYEGGIQEVDELARSGGSDNARSRGRRFLC